MREDFPAQLRAEGSLDKCFLCKGPLGDEPVICATCQEKAKQEEELRIEMGRTEREEAERSRIANLHQELVRIGFTLEHARGNLAEHTKATQGLVKAFMETPEVARGLLVCGPVGTGKTHLLAAIAREYLVKRADVRFLMARELFRRIRETYEKTAQETESEVIADLTECDLLLVDDLSKEGRSTDATVGALHEILSKRHGNFLPTAVTTNLSIDQIAERYDPSIASRLNAWTRLVLAGKDRRV